VPPLIAQIPAKYGIVNVYEQGPACTGTSCTKNIEFFVPGGYGITYSCSPAEVHGPDLRVDDGWGNFTIPLTDGTCYAPNPAGQYAQNALTSTFGHYVPTGPATPSGWAIQPGSSFSVIALTYKRPFLEKLAGDYWDNQCAPFEALTPPSQLPPDGTSKPLLPPLMPLANSNQCQRVSSACVEGPSTKVIDGYNVTRECWRYANQFDCTTLDPGSTCNTPPLNACTPTGTATCSASPLPCKSSAS
jgi:conjugal transfer mating pair stabilization protein TraN